MTGIILSLPLLIQSVTVQGTRYPVTLETQVGQFYDTRVIDRDIQHLWRTSRFADIRVETTGEGSVIFNLVEARQARLHQIHVEPPTAGLQFKVPDGTPISRLRAHQIALDARRQLNDEGYMDARVDYDVVPFATNEVDLRLTIDKGKKQRVKKVQLIGDAVLDRKELRRAGKESDATRVQSLYLSKGYLDAKVRVDHFENSRLTFLVEPGPLNPGAPRGRELCSCLFAARREAERKGVIDFSATLGADQTVQIDRGTPYRVGRIEFSGNHHVSDATLRRNFLLDEGDLLDERLLRKSVDRLNRTQLFEPIHTSDILVRSDEKTGIADLGIRLTERKRGAWGLSGPVGPASFAGPLQASISSRLPPWGRGIFELSTYSVSLSMFAFAHPILPAWALASKYPLLPVLALHRPFTPVGGWTSGWTFAPQIGWRGSALSYATVQIQQRTLPLLAGNRGMEPELVIKVERPDGEVPMFCDPPRPRFMGLRRAASLSVQFLGVFTAF